MGIFDINGRIMDYRHPSLLPSARESRLFSHDQHTADAQSYANIIAFLQSNQSRERGSGAGGGGRRDNNDRTIINESLSVNQMNNPTRNYDHRNNNNNNNNDDERKQHISSSLSSISDSIPLFGLEELSEADIDTDSFIDGFFHSHYILPSSPLVLSHPLASSSTINNNNNHNNNTNNSGPIRHHRTRIPSGFSLGSSLSSPSTPLLPSSLIADHNNDDRFIEEELPVEFLQPPSSSPQPVIDYQTSISLLDGIQEFAAI